MAYHFSKYVRDGLSAIILSDKNFYGSKRKFAYHWGIFRGGELQTGLKLQMTYEECKLPHLRPYPFGEKPPCHMTMSQFGTYVNGEPDGYCYTLDTNGLRYDYGFYERGEKVDRDTFLSHAQVVPLTKGRTSYMVGDYMLIENQDGSPFYMGGCDAIGMVQGYGTYFDIPSGHYDFGYYEMEDHSTYLDTPIGEVHPVCTPAETGYSAITRIYHHRRIVRYTREEGVYQGGALCGIGFREEEDTAIDTSSRFSQEGGLYENGTLVWGFRLVWISGECQVSNEEYFRFIDGTPDWYQEETLTLDTGRYVGQVEKGLPHGIGTLYKEDGHMVVGMWKEGTLHGWGGVFFQKNGQLLRAEDGLYVNGHLTYDGLITYCKAEGMPLV